MFIKCINAIMNSKSLVLLLLTVLLLSLSHAEQRIITEEAVFAEFEGGKITKADFDLEFEKIPVMYRSRYTSLEGQEDFLRSLVVNEIFYLEALERGIDQNPEIQQQILEAITPFYSRHFIRKEISEKVEVPEADVIEFYESNPGRFSTQPNTVIRYLKTHESEEAQEVKEGIESGEDFYDLMNKYSVNSHSKRNQGMIRDIRGNGYIRGVGRDEQLDNAIKEAPLNEWQGPLHTDVGYHFFKVTERQERELKPLEEVREQIIARLKPRVEHQLRQNIYQELKEKYEVELLENKLADIRINQIRPGSELLEEVVVNSPMNEFRLTLEDVHQHIQRISPQERAQLDNPEHLKRMIQGLLEQRLFGHEVVERGYQEELMQDPDVEHVKKIAVLRALYQEMVIDEVAASPEEIEQFYNQNLNNYRIRENISAQLFRFDSRGDARRAHREVRRALREEDQERINEVAARSLYSDNYGMIKSLSPDQIIPNLGEDQEILKTLWDTDQGELSRRRRDEDGKYFFVRVIEQNPESYRPLEEVEADIQNRLTAARREQRFAELQEDLLQKYRVNFNYDKLAHSITAKELFQLAEDALKRNRHHEAIEHYDRIIMIYNNNEDDYKAHFMKAFLYAEELQDDDKAVTLFEELLETYPHADLHESAEFMIKALRHGYDIFDD